MMPCFAGVWGFTLTCNRARIIDITSGTSSKPVTNGTPEAQIPTMV